MKWAVRDRNLSKTSPLRCLIPVIAFRYRWMASRCPMLNGARDDLFEIIDEARGGSSFVEGFVRLTRLLLHCCCSLPQCLWMIPNEQVRLPVSPCTTHAVYTVSIRL